MNSVTFSEGIDRNEQHTKTLFYGVPKMTVWLKHQRRWIDSERIWRRMRLTGIEVTYPKPQPNKGNRYLYLPSGLTVDHPNQVWYANNHYHECKMFYMEIVDSIQIPGYDRTVYKAGMDES